MVEEVEEFAVVQAHHLMIRFLKIKVNIDVCGYSSSHYATRRRINPKLFWLKHLIKQTNKMYVTYSQRWDLSCFVPFRKCSQLCMWFHLHLQGKPHSQLTSTCCHLWWPLNLCKQTQIIDKISFSQFIPIYKLFNMMKITEYTIIIKLSNNSQTNQRVIHPYYYDYYYQIIRLTWKSLFGLISRWLWYHVKVATGTAVTCARRIARCPSVTVVGWRLKMNDGLWEAVAVWSSTAVPQRESSLS